MFLLLLVLGLWLSLVYSRRINRDMRRLVRDASAIGRGEMLGPPPRDSLEEIAAVHAALMTASDELKAREERQGVMINELNHRVKNTLATVQALARQTFAKIDGAPLNVFTERLIALSGAHDLLTRTGWREADMAALIQASLGAHGDRVDREGPTVALAPHTAVGLSMVFHELATNSAKYGALSAAGGRVALTWRRDPVTDTLFFTWRDIGGPPVTPPTAAGFGTRLIESSIRREQKGQGPLRLPARWPGVRSLAAAARGRALEQSALMTGPLAGVLTAFMAQERLPPTFAALAEVLHQPLAARIAAWAGAQTEAPLVVGVCGPQGSGKSTLVLLLAQGLAAQGLRTAVLSIDDLYLPRAARQRLAREIHPLLQTRGVPGTHDPALGLAVLDALAQPGPTPLPRFDKAADDRAPEADWPLFEGPADVVLLEGWCVGARPEPPEPLATPVNALEAQEDPDGAWRAYANAALSGPYRPLFDRLDRLVVLTTPDFATVRAWRGEQEAKLVARLAAEGRDAARTMDAAALDRFLAHYQRLTAWIAQDLPAIADVAVTLDADRWPVETRGL